MTGAACSPGSRTRSRPPATTRSRSPGRGCRPSCASPRRRKMARSWPWSTSVTRSRGCSSIPSPCSPSTATSCSTVSCTARPRGATPSPTAPTARGWQSNWSRDHRIDPHHPGRGGSGQLRPDGRGVGRGRNRPQAVPRDHDLSQPAGDRCRGGEPDRRRDAVRPRRDFQRSVPGGAGHGGARRGTRGGVLLAGSPGPLARRHAAPRARRHGRGAPRRAARVSRLQPRAQRGARGGDPRHADPPPAARPDPRRVRAVAGDRGQDRGPARARSDGSAHGLRAPRTRRAMRIFVEAPARLHFGVLDLRGDLGRRFGGIGAAVPAPSLLLEARPAAELNAEGPDAARTLEFARRFARHHDRDLRLHFCVHRSIPAHAGLGSGTQLALAVARASAELSGLPTDVTALARAVDRGRRSGVGTWTFAHGGFVLEGGRTPRGPEENDADRVAPLLARMPFPAAWRCVVAVPRGTPGLAGDEEAAAFARLPPAPAREVERVAHLVLLQLLPALAEGDLADFGAALAEVQRITGRWFAPVQGGGFAPGETGQLVERLREWGAVGVGQSSWGPAVYGIVGDARDSEALAERVRGILDAGGM